MGTYVFDRLLLLHGLEVLSGCAAAHAAHTTHAGHASHTRKRHVDDGICEEEEISRDR